MQSAQAQPTRRRIELDALRGLMLVWITCTHLPTIASTYVNQPFGFVSAAESKQALADGQSLPVPYITCLGRKGGSPCAVATVNALLLLAEGGSPIKG